MNSAQNPHKMPTKTQTLKYPNAHLIKYKEKRFMKAKVQRQVLVTWRLQKNFATEGFFPMLLSLCSYIVNSRVSQQAPPCLISLCVSSQALFYFKILNSNFKIRLSQQLWMSLLTPVSNDQHCLSAFALSGLSLFRIPVVRTKKFVLTYPNPTQF